MPGFAMLALAATVSPHALGGEVSALVDIVVERPVDGQLLIAAEVLGFADDGELSVDLQIERRGAAGTVVSTQSQALVVASGARMRAGVTSVSFVPGDRIVAVATLRRGGTVISTASISAGEEKQNAAGQGEVN